MIHVTGKIEDHFAQIPNVVFRNPELSPRAVVVLGNILTHTERFTLTTTVIAEQTGMNRKTVAAALEDLEKIGYITRRKNPPENGRFAPDDYEVNIWHIIQSARAHRDQKTDTGHAQKLDTHRDQKTDTHRDQNLDTKEYKGEQKGEEARATDPITAALDELAAQTAAQQPTYPDHCPQHAHIADPGPCHNCQRVREHHAAQTAEQQRQNREQERARRAGIAQCTTCNHLGRRDQYGPATGTTYEVRCQHTEADQRAQQEADKHRNTNGTH